MKTYRGFSKGNQTMKQKLLTRLVAGIVGGVAAVGGIGLAQAGQIDLTPTNVAREVIPDNALAINAPAISYRFISDIDARSQDRTHQVQFILEEGTFVDGIDFRTAFSITSNTPANNSVLTQTTDGLEPTSDNPVAVPAYANDRAWYTVDAIGLSTDKKIAFVTFTIKQSPAFGLVNQPLVTLNASTNRLAAGGVLTNQAAASAPGVYDTPVVATNKAKLDGLYDVVGDVTASCGEIKDLYLNIKDFVNPTAGAGVLANESTATEGEHVQPGHSDRKVLISFPTNLKLTFTPSNGDAKLAAGSATFAGTGTGTIPSFVSSTLINLGRLRVSQSGYGYDIDLTNQYLLSGLVTASTAISGNTGKPELEKLRVVVSATDGFSEDGKLHLDTGANCSTSTVAGASANITAANKNGPITLDGTAPAAALSTTGGPVYVCYTVSGTDDIPPSSFSAVGTLVKASNADTTNLFREQNNVCDGSLYALGGGIKIDVRNYASKRFGNDNGWISTIRFINNSESRTAKVYGQIIQTDGKYGPWGLITELAPRAVKNISSDVIDDKLTEAPIAGSANGDSSADAAGAAGENGAAPRLRITSNNGSTLRVQNYVLNPSTGQVLEFSGAQGVDFDPTATRSPDTSQTLSQDAEAGLNGK
jgi:hypothetical protein